MRVIGVHGFRSSPQGGFWPWLSKELRDRGFDVVLPELPNPEEPAWEEWTKVLVEAAGNLSENDILVGHGLGGAAALRLLEAAPARTTPRACILIATPWMIRDERFRGFFLTDLDHDVLMWRASHFSILHAPDDPGIPFTHAEQYAKIFHGELLPVPGAGRFDAPEQPAVLAAILSAAGAEVKEATGAAIPDAFATIDR